ncbi:MAG: c-type cytochrome [Anaerolineae bacterium]
MRWLLLRSILIVIGITGCGRVVSPPYQATALIYNAQGSATAIINQAQQAIGAVVTATSSPTVTVTAIPTHTPTETVAPRFTLTPVPSDTPLPPTEDNDPLAVADIEQGEMLFNTFQPAASFACATCHHAASEDRLIGPGLLNIGERASQRIDGVAVIDYLYQSIVEPDAYIVENFPESLMPQNWSEIYTDDEIFDIIAYLLTLQ